MISKTLDEAIATLEASHQSEDQSKFLRYTNAKRVNSILFDHTNGTAPGYSVRLFFSAESPVSGTQRHLRFVVLFRKHRGPLSGLCWSSHNLAIVAYSNRSVVDNQYVKFNSDWVTNNLSGPDRYSVMCFECILQRDQKY